MVRAGSGEALQARERNCYVLSVVFVVFVCCICWLYLSAVFVGCICLLCLFVVFAMETNCLIKDFTMRMIIVAPPSCLIEMMTLVTTTRVTLMRLGESGNSWKRRRRSPEMPAGGNAPLPEVDSTL